MIRNLNQVAFQGFGTVLPERAQNAQSAHKNAIQMKLTQMEAAVFRARADTLLTCSGGMSILSVSKDGASFEHFYLDKIALVKPGVYFGVSPF